MTKKSEIKKEILDEAYRRGYDYMPKKSWPCAPAVFAAVMDTLGYEDDPVINDVWKATIGFTGGTGNMAIGTCGAMDACMPLKGCISTCHHYKFFIVLPSLKKK